MNTICFIMPGKLPIPSICGGAIETLLTLFINENEKYQRFNIVVISSWAKGIEKTNENYKFCKFIYIKVPLLARKCVNAINFFIAKISGNIDYFKTPFHYRVERIMKNVKADKVIVEHGVYKHFEFLMKTYQRENLYLHIHGVGSEPDIATQNLYGNIICVSEFVEKNWKNLYHDAQKTNFFICHNGIKKDVFCNEIDNIEKDAVRKKLGIDSHDFIVLYCGRLIPIKGVLELIKAVNLLKNPSIKLMIIGESGFKGSSKTGYIDKIINESKKNEQNVIFTGYIDNSELYKYYQIASLQVVPSLCEEGAGLVCIEGMMSGLPLIVTDSGGVPEYVNDSCAICIKKNNAILNENDRFKFIEQLRDSIKYLHNNKKIRDDMAVKAKSLALMHDEKAYYDNLSQILID